MAFIKKAIAALNDEISVNCPNDDVSMATLQLPTGWAGTVVVEASNDDATTWVALGLTPAAGGAVVANAAAAGMWNTAYGVYDRIRARVSVAGAGGVAVLGVAAD